MADTAAPVNGDRRPEAALHFLAHRAALTARAAFAQIRLRVVRAAQASVADVEHDVERNDADGNVSE